MNLRFECRRGRGTTAGVWLGAIAALVLSAPGLEAQGTEVLRGPIRGGFAVAEADQRTGARKYALWGESATPLTANQWEVLSPRLELYGEGEATNLVFLPNRCLYNRETQRITSSEPLRMWSGDGYLQLQGEGFSLDLEARRLWVSNRVEALMHKRLFERAGVPLAGSVRAGAGEPGTDMIRIRSDRLEYGNDRAEFLDRVQAEDAAARMECRRLSVDLTPGAPELRGIEAAGDVRFTAGELVVEASRAHYEPARGRLELDHDPRWLYRGRPGRARQVVLERDRESLSALGEVWLELPAESFTLTSLPANLVPAERDPVSSEPVRITAERLEIVPRADGGEGRLLELRDAVTILQGESRLECDTFQLRTEGADHAVARAEARGNVRIERGGENMNCERAEYDAESASAAFIGGVAWASRGRSGAAERIWLELAENRYHAEGEVRMRFEQADASWAGWLAPGEGADPSAGEVLGLSAKEGDPTEVACDRFEYQGSRAAGTLQTAIYQGDVTVRQGDKMHLNCMVLRAELGPETNQVRSVVADGNVEVRATDGDGYRLARGDRATYDAERQEIVLTGREGVDFFVIAPNGVSRGTGRQAIYRRDTDTLLLAGEPAITTPEGELVGREVRMDRQAGVLSASGPWRIRLPLGGLEMPRLPVP